MEFNLKFYLKFIDWLKCLIHEFTQRLTSVNKMEEKTQESSKVYGKELNENK